MFLSEQRKKLLQKEEQKTVSGKEINEAVEQQQVLENDLLQICQSLQEVSMKTSKLTRKKERLELDMARQELKKKKLSAALTSKPSKELVTEMVYEVHSSIIDLKEDLRHLESEISSQIAKEEQMKQELFKNKKEADENRQALEELKEKHKHFSSALDSQRKILAEDVQRAENRQEELNNILQETRNSLQQLATKSANLATEKEQLEQEISENEKLQEELMSQKSLNGDIKLLDKMKANIQASIDSNRKRLAHVVAKIEKQRAKENHLKQEAANKEKELEENHRLVHELKQKHLIICSILEANRIIFDCQLRQTHQSSENWEKECKVSN